MYQVRGVFKDIDENYVPQYSNQNILNELLEEFSLHNGNSSYYVFKNAPKNYSGVWINAAVLLSTDTYKKNIITNLINIFQYITADIKDSEKIDLIIQWLEANLKSVKQ